MSNNSNYGGQEQRTGEHTKTSFKDIFAIISAIVAACSLTFAITTGAFANRLTTVEGKISVLEMTVTAIKAEFGTKLDLLIKSTDKLENTIQAHMAKDK